MINTIEIIIQSGTINNYHFVIKYNELKAYADGKSFELTKEFLDELIRTMRFWKNEYGNDTKLDNEEFTIIITTNNNIERIHGKGYYPVNYSHLIEMLGEIK